MKTLDLIVRLLFINLLGAALLVLLVPLIGEKTLLFLVVIGGLIALCRACAGPHS